MMSNVMIHDSISALVEIRTHDIWVTASRVQIPRSAENTLVCYHKNPGLGTEIQMNYRY